MRSQIPQGFRPINTLNGSSEPGQHSSQGPKQSTVSGAVARPGLQLEASVGNNVPQPRALVNDMSGYELPLPKRRKLGPQMSRQEAAPLSSDGVDPLHMDPEGDVVASLSRNSGKISQATSDRTQVKSTSQSGIDGHVAEYKAVEGLMDSNPSKAGKKRPRSRRPQNQGSSRPESATLPGACISTASNPIQLSDDDMRDVPSHGASAKRKGQNIRSQSVEMPRGMLRQPLTGYPRDMGGRSPYFPTSASPKKEARLNEQFKTTEGKRRNEEYSSSPDELADSSAPSRGHGPYVMGTTGVASSGSASPVKSSSSTRKGTPTAEELGGLEPSNFPNTQFDLSVSRKAASKDRDRHNEDQERSEQDCEFRLAAVSVRGEMLNSPNLGLLINPRTTSYEVFHGTENLALKDPSLQIHPRKVHKALWSGAKVRFQSAKSGTSDGLLDLELWGEKACQDLLRRLQDEAGPTLDIKKTEDHRLDRCIERRLLEQSKNQAFMSNRAVDENEDILVAAHNKANRHPTYVAPGLVEGAGAKRRRVDRLSDGMRISKDQTKASLSNSDRGGLPDIHGNHSLLDIGESSSRVFENTQSLQSDNRNSHRTRSRVLKDAGRSELPSSLTRESSIEKLPRIYDLGEPWRKPLIYPKTGKKKSTVEWTDLGRLNEGEFFNDTLISFYLRYLENQLEERNPAMARKVYFFNTFFFASLTKTQRGQRGINYEAVQKWVRGDIFNCDYVVVPINESMHWYLAVICNLPALDRELSQLSEDAASSPCVNIEKRSDQERGLSRPLSPSSITPVSETTLVHVHPTQVAAKPTEEDARSSFAELSLEPEAKPHDQDLLDAQFRNERPAAITPPDEAPQKTPFFCEEVTNTDNPIEPETPITGTSSKKRKRKSMPPAKKLLPTEPAIVTFDSLAMAHAPTVRILKDYLKAEAHAKRQTAFDETQIKGMTAVGIPKQDNYCDCGPYLLGYMDQFVEDPKGFMTQIMQKQLDPERDWPRLDPSNLRSSIRDLILGLHKEQEDQRKENARKVGTSKSSKKSSSSPLLEPLQADKEPEAITQAIKTTLGSVSATHVKPGLNDGQTTRKEALEHALRVDEAEQVEIKDQPNILHKDETDGSAYVQEGGSLIIIDSQPVESQSAAEPADVNSLQDDESEESSSALPSTIQDSQPDTFQSLEELYQVPAKTPPKPVTATFESTKSTPRSEMFYSPPLGQDLTRQRPDFKGPAKSHVFVQID